MRTLGQSLGLAYGFDSVDPHTVLISYGIAVPGHRLAVHQMTDDAQAWATGCAGTPAARELIAELLLPDAMTEGYPKIWSLAYDSVTATYFLAVERSSDTAAVFATSDLGATWQDTGSVRVDSQWRNWQLHFLEGSSALFMRTYDDWYRLPREHATAVSGRARFSVKWAELRSD